MRNENVGKIIFSRILQMPLGKYLAFIEKSIPLEERDRLFIAPCPASAGGQMPTKKIIYANLTLRNGTIIAEILDGRLQMKYSPNGLHDRKTMFALRWINTRNEFSYHVLQSLVTYQRDYFFSGKELDLKPLTFKEYLSRFPCQYLDQSRLSRLVGNLLVRVPQNEIISLRNLYVSRRRWYAYHVKQVVDESASPASPSEAGRAGGDHALTDSEIQAELKSKGIYLTVRTICNCRRLLNIPHHKERASYYYGRNVAFSNHKVVSEKRFSKIPVEPGVYELSLDSRIDYPKHTSNVIYLGSSVNLRKRIATYSGRKLKNARLSLLVGRGVYDTNGPKTHRELFVRYVVSSEYRTLEKALLKSFKSNYGTLPNANTIGEFL